MLRVVYVTFWNVHKEGRPLGLGAPPRPPCPARPRKMKRHISVRRLRKAAKLHQDPPSSACIQYCANTFCISRTTSRKGPTLCRLRVRFLLLGASQLSGSCCLAGSGSLPGLACRDTGTTSPLCFANGATTVWWRSSDKWLRCSLTYWILSS